jgi:hypothetical protein
MCCVSFVYQMMNMFVNTLYDEINCDEMYDNALKTTEEIVPLTTSPSPSSPKDEHELFMFDFEFIDKDEAT